jgi:hypothetical protein
MSKTKLNYNKEADVLYVSFGRSDHVTGPVSDFLGVELSLLLQTPPLPEQVAL